MNDKTITIPVQGASGAFANLLAGMKRGAVLGDLDDTLKEVVTAINATGKPGTISLKLKIVPEGKSDSESPIYAITEDISVKKPRKSRGVAKFFGDEEGNLMRNDPKQDEMKFGEIEGEKPAATTATAAVGFITTDDSRVGASPDGLIGTDGGFGAQLHRTADGHSGVVG